MTATITESTKDLMLTKLYGQVREDLRRAEEQYHNWELWCERIKAKDLRALELWREMDDAYRVRIQDLNTILDRIKELEGGR